MNKQDLIKEVTKHLSELDRFDVEAAVNATLKEIAAALYFGEEVRLSGFGTFRRVVTKARACRNPQTGEVFELPAGHKVKFKASDKLKVTP